MFAEVAIPLHVKQTFTYSLSEWLREKAQPGCRVIVPLGKKLYTAYIVALHESLDPSLADVEVKEIEELVDETPVVTPEILDLTRWIADYYIAPWGEVIKAALPSGINVASETILSITDIGREILESVPPNRLQNSSKWQALQAIAEAGMLSSRELQKTFSKARVSAIARELEEAGFIRVTQQLGQITSKPKLQNVVRLVKRSETEDGKPFKEQQQRVIEVLSGLDEPLSLSELTARAGVSASVVRTLEKRGAVEIFAQEVRRDPLAHIPVQPIEEFILTDKQTEIWRKIVDRIDQGEYTTFLLHGVTGSGKTEVYIRAMRAAIERGKTALMLVPEISLTPMFSRRLRNHFADLVAILHSSLSDGERLDEWNRIRQGEARICIGTRSAVFAPLENLGLVVVDEEHETSYKQEETPRYHGRDTAIMRALKAKAVVVLGSATPSLESYHNAQQGKYIYFRMPDRIGGRSLADVEVIDMRQVFARHGKQQALSDELKSAIAENFERGQQTMVLLNRRGFSAFVLCRSCGLAIHCPNCDVTLTYHRGIQRLVCHYCNHQTGVPNRCPVCEGKYIYYVGEGTEQLEALLRELFPTKTIARLDRDTTRRRGSYEKIITEFASGSIDLLVGTQMIAKGHDFPNVTLVGVVSVDAGLGLPDFRAAERTFQLLTQVAGRAGRGDRPGRVMIQTYHPEHYSLTHARAQDYQAFYQQEIRFRQVMHYPPFTALINLLIHHKDLAQANAIAAETARQLTAASADRSMRILGPAPAPLSRLRGEHRLQILIKARNRTSARQALDVALENIVQAGYDLRHLTVEVDPINLM